ncbi:putative membrane protein [Hartmannibacter diazotrophicus]|uniref:Putative membrane protein n=1 Tax=Hartmannibacter diazotrophicus TaxID=1482074 RepID=A0A2C9D668_9HYPH|nr:DUF2177 family protein [Hartmannibacter diazotrophicus]SON55638.1 putative membrane protein [Hartmannibacter diazotrophicus]
MTQYLISFVATALAFLGLDAIWLSVMASRLYRPKLGSMLADTFNLPAAAVFYVLYIFGLTFFVLTPALASGRWQTAALYGALFGLVAYGTYDLTNQATLKDWPVLITIVDLCWGMFVTSAACIVGFKVTQAVTGSM